MSMHLQQGRTPLPWDQRVRARIARGLPRERFFPRLLNERFGMLVPFPYHYEEKVSYPAIEMPHDNG
jgi:hypothetical protein